MLRSALSHSQLLPSLSSMATLKELRSPPSPAPPSLRPSYRLLLGHLLAGGQQHLPESATPSAAEGRHGRGHEWEKAEARERGERLEEWKAAEGERRLEKVAEEFLKKQMKKSKKVAGDGEAHKYVAKYRDESERCVAEFAESVKEALKSLNGKRKGSEAALEKADSKKLKIWLEQ
ncbi:hypothetical protein S83_019545 [Arachis hypogaea]